MDKDELKALLEALIFAADHPVSMDKLAGVVEGTERDAIREALKELAEEYSAGRGLVLEEVAGGWRLRTRPEHATWIRRLFKIGMQKVSRAAMESLAILAYKQPVTRAELEDVRGVDSAGVLRTLLDRRLIKIVGRKDAPGRPVVYGTTKEFLETFDLKDLSSLPTLKEIEMLEAEEDGSEDFETPVYGESDAKGVAAEAEKDDKNNEPDSEDEDGGGNDAVGVVAKEGEGVDDEEDEFDDEESDAKGVAAEEDRDEDVSNENEDDDEGDDAKGVAAEEDRDEDVSNENEDDDEESDAKGVAAEDGEGEEDADDFEEDEYDDPDSEDEDDGDEPGKESTSDGGKTPEGDSGSGGDVEEEG